MSSMYIETNEDYIAQIENLYFILCYILWFIYVTYFYVTYCV